MIEITSDIHLEEGELSWEFVRSSGPGGQNVNKVSSAVQLRFDVANSPSLSDEIKGRLVRLGGKRLTEEGILIISARRYRSQDKNRQDALERLMALIRKAAEIPKTRKATHPSQGVKKRRLDEKRRQSAKKQLRTKPSLDD